MLQPISLRSAPEVARVIRAAFPSYKKHNAYLSAFSEVQVNSYWDGGSKSYFALVDLATLQTKAMPSSSHPFFEMRSANAETPDVSVERGVVTLKRLPEGIALVESSIFCGKQATVHVYLNQVNMAKLLPAGGAQ